MLVLAAFLYLGFTLCDMFVVADVVAFPLPFAPMVFVFVVEAVVFVDYFCFSANLKAVFLAIFLIFVSLSFRHPSKLTFLLINLILLLFL